jgi:hypothetical protein
MKHRLLSIGYASLLLGFIFNWFFYGHYLGVNFFLYEASVLALTAGLMMYWRRQLSRSVLGLSLVAVFFSTAIFIRASGFVQFLDVLIVLYLMWMIGLLIWRPRISLRDFTSLDYLRRTMQVPFLSIIEFGSVLRKAAGFNLQSKNASKQNMLPVVRGILISLPILVVFILLFSSADLVFKHYVSSIFTFHVSPVLISHMIMILVVTAFFIGAYALLFTGSPPEEYDQPTTKTVHIGSIEATIVLSSIVTLFLIFVVIQLHYLFGGQSNIMAAGGYTYADYARKGFFELIVAALITFLLLLALHTSTVRRTIRQHLIFVTLCTVLVLEVGLVMLSAHRRLSLYEQAYGFTELRLYSHLFIGWLVAAIGLLLAYIARDQPQKLFARGMFISIIIFLAVINLINPDAFVAHENIQRFRSTGKLDVAYLGSLSADATPALGGLLDNRDRQVQKSAAYQLYMQQQVADQSDQSWQAFNVSRHRAQEIRRSHQAQLEANKDYQDPTARRYSD